MICRKPEEYLQEESDEKSEDKKDKMKMKKEEGEICDGETDYKEKVNYFPIHFNSAPTGIIFSNDF